MRRSSPRSFRGSGSAERNPGERNACHDGPGFRCALPGYAKCGSGYHRAAFHRPGTAVNDLSLPTVDAALAEVFLPGALAELREAGQKQKRAKGRKR